MDIKPFRRHGQRPDQTNGVASPASVPVAAPAEPSARPEGILPGQPADNPKKRDGWRSILSTIVLFLLAPIIAIGIAAFALQSYQVDGSSMETTLQNSDRLIVDKIPRSWSRLTHHPYIPKRGDIVVFNQAGLFDAGGASEKQLIKRVIGLPGDRVVVSGGKYTVYNAQHPTGFNPDTTGGYKITQPTYPTGNYTDVTLKANNVFVSGDNRTNSEDSRAFGPVNVDRIVGQLILRIVPLNKTERF